MRLLARTVWRIASKRLTVSFVSGKILENLALGHPPRLPDTSHSASQPPTPPSTPLSPKYCSGPVIPNITITQTSSPSIPQYNQNPSSQKGPLDLDTKRRASAALYSNGSTGLAHLDFEALRSKIVEQNRGSDSAKQAGVSNQNNRVRDLLFPALTEHCCVPVSAKKSHTRSSREYNESNVTVIALTVVFWVIKRKLLPSLITAPRQMRIGILRFLCPFPFNADN